MANTANTAPSILTGPGGTGYATVLGTQAPSLFEVMDGLKADRLADEALKRQEEQARGKRFNELLEYSPEAVWQEYDQEIQDEYNKYMDFISSKYAGGGNPTEQDEVEMSKMRNAINAHVNYYNTYKTEVDEARKRVNTGEEAKYYNQDFFERYLGEVNYDENGNKRDITQLSPDLITDMYNDDRLYNWDEITKGFVGNYGETEFDRIKNERSGLTITKEKMSQIYQMDEETGLPETDSNGNYILKPSKQSFKSAMSDNFMKRNIERRRAEMEEVTDQPVSNYEAYEEIISGYTDRSSTVSHKWDPRTNTWAKNSFGNKKEEEKGRLRKKLIAQIQAGNPEMLGELKGAKSGKNYVTKVDYDPIDGIILTYDNDEEEIIPTGDFGRLNDLISTKTNQDPISPEILSTIEEAPEVKPYQTIDSGKLNQDIKSIQEGEGIDMIKGLEGVKDVEYNIPTSSDSPSSITITLGKNKKVEIDLTEENKGGYQELKKFILSKDKESYKKVRGAGETAKGVGAKYNK
jgi:hypothetical protein